jgi:DNA-directed RNA polymerase subunit F
MQSVRDDLNKLSAGVNNRVSRHIKSTKEQNDSLRKDVNTELNVAKQEISTLMQDVNKNNQEVRDSFCQSELANAQKFAELEREQISRLANNTSVQPNNSALSVVRCSQVNPATMQSVNLAHRTHRV